MSRILVVGGGSGIGEHVTHFLLNRHGAKVAVLGLHITEGISQLARDNKIRFIQGDATTPGVQKQALELVSDYLCGLDALVITQGVLGDIETIGSLDVEKMRRAFEINVFTPVQLVRFFIPLVYHIMSLTADPRLSNTFPTFDRAKAALSSSLRPWIKR